jgi:hypothetical protein
MLVIELMLNDLIVSARPQRNYGTLAAVLAASGSGEEDYQGYQTFVTGLGIGGRVGKVALAKGLSLLRTDQALFIEGVARVRSIRIFASTSEERPRSPKRRSTSSASR